MPEYRPKKKKKSRAGSVVLTLVVFVLFLAIFGGVCLWAFIDNRLPPGQRLFRRLGGRRVAVHGSRCAVAVVAAQDGTEPRGLSPSGRIRRMGGSTPLPSAGNRSGRRDHPHPAG